MASITLSVPKDVKEKMKKFEEVNWSAFVRKSIIVKTEELSWKEEMFEKLKKEKGLDMWAVKLARSARKGRFQELKKKGLV
ncbi:MAG TPA: hypothetical protein VJK05_01455 [archaeon]|nr:hypothetical protein [archaeon]